MNITSKVAISGILVLATIVFGILIHKTGKPYNTALFAVHKLTTLGFIVLLSFIIINYIKINTLSFGFNACLIFALLSVIALFISGAMLSLEKLNNTMLLIHRIATTGFVICIIFIIWKILKY